MGIFRDFKVAEKVMSNYSTSLTKKHWQVIKNIIEPEERSLKHFLRDILNAILKREIQTNVSLSYRKHEENKHRV